MLLRGLYEQSIEGQDGIIEPSRGAEIDAVPAKWKRYIVVSAGNHGTISWWFCRANYEGRFSKGVQIQNLVYTNRIIKQLPYRLHMLRWVQNDV